MQDIKTIRKILDTELSTIPIYQYAFLPPAEIEFDGTLRSFCKRLCGNYGLSWSCPPAVGKIEQCMSRCLSYEDVLVFSTAEKRREAKRIVYIKGRPYFSYHEQITCEVEKVFEKNGLQVYTLTSNMCAMCKKCVYPKAECRYPDVLHPCIEGHGIRVDELAEQIGVDYYLDDYQLKFTVVFYKQGAETI